MRLSSLRSLIIAVIAAGLSLGCGGGEIPLGEVNGTVSMSGKPLPGVKVTFVPQGHGSPSYGATNQNGEYRLFYRQDHVGALLGAHNVLIEGREQETDDSGNPIGSAPVKVPEKYRRPGVLLAEVRSGRNEVNFTLKETTDP